MASDGTGLATRRLGAPAPIRSTLAALVPILCGIGLVLAWQAAMWGLVAGLGLLALGVGAHNGAAINRPRPGARDTQAPIESADAIVQRLLLDAAPTPLVGVEGGTARALNRAARRLFATDDRILPLPPALADPTQQRLPYEGRHWRIDRVTLADAERHDRAVVALVDIEQEERVAEARATAELIQVLGHELLNGLAPIVSLAESGLAAASLPATDPTLLPEILGTLARRAEGLQRFTEAYRALARLPAPTRRPVPIAEMLDDLARLFAVRWPGVTLAVDRAAPTDWPLDRDQIGQALWALLNNAAQAASDGAAPQVTLSARMEGNGLALDVRDSGAGIAATDRERIFRPFHTTRAEGTGVGLSLARQIAHAHGGSLELLPDAPTTFRMTLTA
ncbi:HAMP domain-containing sensor histidine kinase [uncultured Sphingomonas sp.]|uniref:sensor histidine kinase n=1 Tax=uncultured Sphingomonas sp. TaxID=158754 RepID=UPI0025FFFF59|nr:HAMP domain-containing sensor histidine kinase [uncultured Sphingomonas sp.]